MTDQTPKPPAIVESPDRHRFVPGDGKVCSFNWRARPMRSYGDWADSGLRWCHLPAESVVHVEASNGS